jgi:hypothetical protein
MCSYGELNQSFLFVILYLFILGPLILGRTILYEGTLYSVKCGVLKWRSSNFYSTSY